LDLICTNKDIHYCCNHPDQRTIPGSKLGSKIAFNDKTGVLVSFGRRFIAITSHYI
jgi:hypothetical protein